MEEILGKMEDRLRKHVQNLKELSQIVNQGYNESYLSRLLELEKMTLNSSRVLEFLIQQAAEEKQSLSAVDESVRNAQNQMNYMQLCHLILSRTLLINHTIRAPGSILTPAIESTATEPQIRESNRVPSKYQNNETNRNHTLNKRLVDDQKYSSLASRGTRNKRLLQTSVVQNNAYTTHVPCKYVTYKHLGSSSNAGHASGSNNKLLPKLNTKFLLPSKDTQLKVLHQKM